MYYFINFQIKNQLTFLGETPIGHSVSASLYDAGIWFDSVLLKTSAFIFIRDTGPQFTFLVLSLTDLVSVYTG